MNIKSLLRTATVFFACGIAGAASASPVTFYFTQEITEIVSDADGRFAAAGLEAGTVIKGSVTYDSTATNLASNTANADTWTVIGGTAVFPYKTVDMSAGQITAFDLGSVDTWQFAVSTLPEDFAFLLTAEGPWGYNRGTSIDVGTGTGHPVLGPPVFGTTFESRAAGYLMSGPSGLSFEEANGRLTFFETDPDPEVVPLPATLPLLLGGLILTAGAARRTKRRAA